MIARRRKRPRVRSASFRTLWWLIGAEARFQIHMGETIGGNWMRERARVLKTYSNHRWRVKELAAVARFERSRYP